MGNRLGSAVMRLGALALVGVLCVTHAEDVGQAFTTVPAWMLAMLVALHLVTLVLRSEAWRLSLASAGGDGLSRGAVHGANAAAFVAGAVQSHAALPARVAVLRRVARERAPRASQICVADLPIVVLELCATALLLAAGALAGRGSWWIALAALAVAVAVVVTARMAPDRTTWAPARGLAVLADQRRRGPLVLLVAGLTGLTAVRVWLVLVVCGLPHGLGDVSWTFATLGLFGVLPLGPGAPAGATLATFGVAQLGAAIAAGLLLAASSIVAVLVYAVAVGLATRLRTRTSVPAPA